MPRFSRCVVLCCAFFAPLAMRADVLGDTLTFERDAGLPPDTFGLGEAFQAPGSVSLNALTISVSANQVVLSTSQPGFAVDEGLFLEIDDVTKDPRITGITLDPASTLGFVTGSLYMPDCFFFDPCPYTPPGYNSVLLEIEGQRPWLAGQQAIFDLTFGPAAEVTPEPGGLALLGTGTLGLVTRRWRRMPR